MFIIFLKLFVGLIILFWSADRLVSSASALASHLGLSPLVIGLTIVGFGTSAPEIFVSIIASYQNNSGIALGNAVGSNITNIGCVLGLCAIFIPLRLKHETIQQEILIMVFFAIFVSLWLWFVGINPVTGFVLLVLLLCYLIWLFYKTQHHPLSKDDQSLSIEFSKEIPQKMPLFIAIFWLLLSLIVLPLSAKLLVDNAVIIAKWFGVSELVIGLTLIAFGTSIPELATSLVGVFKKEHHLAVGNVIGSNIFNLTAVLLPTCFLGLTQPIDPLLFSRDLPVMLGFSLLFLLMSQHKKKIFHV
ncbi:MAG TPA: calcium/sodium antiporter, partial [Gammaproteobacteria bacterium]|nr:calcium/sodium antiporter [Gammaproteobacteria bacterium]